ncbi:MAG: hypothetical protein M1379_17410 [Firmicutes bacterium]|nr:hypothetical protein [Bacillota bacterium]
MGNTFEIEEFTVRALEVAGAEVTEEQKGKWRAEVPAGLRRELGLGEPGAGVAGNGKAGEDEPALFLAFDGAFAGEPSVEYVAPGSLFLDRLMASTRERGKTASFLWPGRWPGQGSDQGSDHGPGREEAGKDEALEWLKPLFAGCVPVRARARLLYQHHILFSFRVAYISDEKREEIRQFLVDSWSEKVFTDFAQEMALEMVNFTPPPLIFSPARREAGTARPGGKRAARRGAPETSQKAVLGEHLAKAGRLRQRAYRLVRLYQVACEALEEAIAPSVAHFTREARQRLDKEAQQVEEYYAALRQEVTAPLRQLIHRVAGAAVRFDLARTAATGGKYERQLAALKKELQKAEKAYDKELGLLNVECERRLGELHEKYAAQVEVELVSAADIYLPRVIYETELAQNGQMTAVVPVSLDLLTGKVHDFYCQGCGKPLELAYLDDTGAVCCRECVEFCERCGGAAAAYGKGLARCHICGRRICGRCAAPCPNPVFRAPRVHVSPVAHASGEEPSAGGLAVCADCQKSVCVVCAGVWPEQGVQWHWDVVDRARGSGCSLGFARRHRRREVAGKAVPTANILSQCFL